MVYTIENEHLTLSVDSMGAQMMHICSRDGREYLWQGDPAYWPDRAPTLFPFIGRLTWASMDLPPDRTLPAGFRRGTGWCWN